MSLYSDDEHLPVTPFPTRDERIQGLLESNNAYQQRYRDAEAEVASLKRTLKAVEKNRDSLHDALMKARLRFEVYRLHHLAKGDVEKALKNADMVDMLSDALDS